MQKDIIRWAFLNVFQQFSKCQSYSWTENFNLILILFVFFRFKPIDIQIQIIFKLILSERRMKLEWFEILRLLEQWMNQGTKKKNMQIDSKWEEKRISSWNKNLIVFAYLAFTRIWFFRVNWAVRIIACKTRLEYSQNIVFVQYHFHHLPLTFSFSLFLLDLNGRTAIPPTGFYWIMWRYRKERMNENILVIQMYWIFICTFFY